MEKICWANTDDFEQSEFVIIGIPAYAPGVSVPVPMGLSSTDVVYLLKEIAKKGIVGMDVMEVCPSFDVKDRTSHLASRIISEVLYSSGEI